MNEVNQVYQAPSATVDLTTDDTDDVMVAFLGDKNPGYYLRVFKKFETGGGILSWNWATFFFTSPWFLYRRLWIWFFVFWLGLPFVATTVGVISAAANPLFGFAMFVFVYFCLAPIFGNYIFYRRALDHVAAAKATSPRLETQKSAAERSGGTNDMGAWIFGVIVYSLFTANLLFSVIPALSELGSELATRPVPNEARDPFDGSMQADAAISASIEARQQVELFYFEHGRYPIDNDEADFVAGSYAHYIDSIFVHEGRVVIEFSEMAHAELMGEQLFMIPAYTGDAFSWTCGSASIDASYLPIRCIL